MSDDRLVQLLTEIRDGQREAAAFARGQAKQVEAMVARQLANQELAIKTQLATATLYRRMMLFVMPVLLLAIAYLAWKVLPHL